MTDEVKAPLFEPFFTTKREGSGTGLGLAMCYGIAKQNRGYLQVSSVLGEGTTVTMYLPREEDTKIEASDQVRTDELPGGDETILVVEDDPWVRRMETMVLRELGYNVLEASNGAEAMVLLKKHANLQIDLLFTDVVMPLMDGSELAGRLSARNSAMKVLYSSGYPNEIIARYGVMESGTNFLMKPFTPDELAVMVRKILDSQ